MKPKLIYLHFRVAGFFGPYPMFDPWLVEDGLNLPLLLQRLRQQETLRTLF